MGDDRDLHGLSQYAEGPRLLHRKYFRSGWNVTKNLTLYAEGRNLTDKTYSGAVTVNDSLRRFANVGQGISAFGGVEFKF